jgi:hypothetical protein
MEVAPSMRIQMLALAATQTRMSVWSAAQIPGSTGTTSGKGSQPQPPTKSCRKVFFKKIDKKPKAKSHFPPHKFVFLILIAFLGVSRRGGSENPTKTPKINWALVLLFGL